jgi:hypothetical protein
MAASTSTTSSLSEEELTLIVKWSGKEYMVRVCRDDSEAELKRRICEVTTVLPKWQKLLYPNVLGSKLANDSVLLSQLPFKASLKMTMTRYYNLSVCAFWLCSCYFGFFYSILLLFVKFQVKFFLVLNKNEKRQKCFDGSVFCFCL